MKKVVFIFMISMICSCNSLREPKVQPVVFKHGGISYLNYTIHSAFLSVIEKDLDSIESIRVLMNDNHDVFNTYLALVGIKKDITLKFAPHENIPYRFGFSITYNNGKTVIYSDTLLLRAPQNEIQDLVELPNLLLDLGYLHFKADRFNFSKMDTAHLQIKLFNMQFPHVKIGNGCLPVFLEVQNNETGFYELFYLSRLVNNYIFIPPAKGVYNFRLLPDNYTQVHQDLKILTKKEVLVFDLVVN